MIFALFDVALNSDKISKVFWY